MIAPQPRSCGIEYQFLHLDCGFSYVCCGVSFLKIPFVSRHRFKIRVVYFGFHSVAQSYKVHGFCQVGFTLTLK